jgi:Kip1 ubiquitination-promoting complex protein 1
VCQPLLEALLAAYEGRLWVTSTDVLVRFWAGSGYAFAPCSDVMESESEGNDIACASSLARQQFSNVCGTQPAMVNKFLNNLINNVNWTVSEFDQSLEEIRNASEADQEEGHDHFRRCALMFELTVNLLRLLEGVVTDGSTLFREGTPPEGCPEAGMNLERVTQLMVHMIERTVSNKLFESVTSAHLTALGGMRKELLLSPIFGTLMVLAGGGGAADSELGAHGMSSIVKCGRLKPEFIEGSGILTLAGLTDVDRDRLVNFQMRFTSAVEAHAALTPEPVDEDAEERTCTICYAGLLDVEFRPCNHRSCRKCITRHLLNDTKCFFCNAQVDLVVHDDGTEVYSREPDAAQ